MSSAPATWTLLGRGGESWKSDVPGAFGGHRKSRIYGRLDCPSALRAIGKGGYVPHRVFFLDEHAARSARYRPCAKCMRVEYARWKRAGQAS